MTGGALVPEKTLWHAINSKWMDGEWKIAPMEDKASNLTMIDTQCRVRETERLDSDSAKRTLGVWKCPSGSDTAKLDTYIE